MFCIHAHNLLDWHCRKAEGRLPPETPIPRAKQISTETRLCLLSTDSAPGWAKSDSRVTKHFFQFLVNREFLAQIKNTTAPLCFLHMSLWQSVCSTDTGASICQCDFGKGDWSSRMTTWILYVDVHIYAHTNLDTQNTYPTKEVIIRCWASHNLTQSTDDDIAQTVRNWPHWEYKPGPATMVHLFILYQARKFFPPSLPTNNTRSCGISFISFSFTEQLLSDYFVLQVWCGPCPNEAYNLMGDTYKWKGR